MNMTAGVWPETISRSQESSTLWMWLSAPRSAAAANNAAVSAATAAVSAVSKRGDGQDQRLRRTGRGPITYRAHAAPLPHSARSSVRRTEPTSVALGSKAIAVSMGIARLGAAPVTKLNW